MWIALMFLSMAASLSPSSGRLGHKTDKPLWGGTFAGEGHIDVAGYERAAPGRLMLIQAQQDHLWWQTTRSGGNVSNWPEDLEIILAKGLWRTQPWRAGNSMRSSIVTAVPSAGPAWR